MTILDFAMSSFPIIQLKSNQKHSNYGFCVRKINKRKSRYYRAYTGVRLVVTFKAFFLESEAQAGVQESNIS